MILLPLLTSLVRSIKASREHGIFATELSVLPLRPNGVQHIIEFIASSLVPPSAVRENQQTLPDQIQEIPMSLEALQQASRLLSSVPESLDARVYFNTVVPQLLALLDGARGPTMSTAAAYIIGTGILGKRSTGAPGTIGWGVFAAPLIETINPGYAGERSDSSLAQSLDRVSLGKVLVPSMDLDLALQRLSKIILSHPNPGLTKRLFRSLLLPLWSLASSKEANSNNQSIALTAWKLLETYTRLYASQEQICQVAKDLLFDGTLHWKYAASNAESIEIQRRSEGQLEESGLIKKIAEIDHRVSLFVKLLSICSISSNVLFAIFTDTIKSWLSFQNPQSPTLTSHPQLSENALLGHLINLRLAMAISTGFHDELATQPLHIVQITDWILADIAKTLEGDAEGANATFRHPTLAQLGQISQLAANGGQKRGLEEVSSDFPAIAALAFSLLDTALQAPNTDFSSKGKQHLESIEASAKIIRQRSHDLPPLLIATAKTVELRIEYLLNGGQTSAPLKQSETTSSQTTVHPSDRIDKDRQVYTEALEKFSSPQPPIRVEGLSDIVALVKASSPAVDVPAITVLLLAMLGEDDPQGTKFQTERNTSQSNPEEADDYIVLGTLRTLTELAEYEPRIVVPLILETYLDRSSSHSLDTRLRVAEGLAVVVDAFTSDTLRESLRTIRQHFVVQIAEAAMIISGRRGRPNLPARERISGLQEDHESVPQLSDVQPIDTPSVEDEALARIVESWGLSPYNEEDLRLRASALSLLAQVLTKCPLSLLGASSLLSSIFDIACAVLRLEPGPQQAIARRAAALVLLNCVRAVDRTFEECGEAALISVRIDVEALLERVGAIAGGAVSGDEDELVRGHAGAILEEMHAWRVKRAVGISEAAGPDTAGMTSELELKDLRGLNVDVRAESERKSDRRVLIEEMED